MVRIKVKPKKEQDVDNQPQEEQDFENEPLKWAITGLTINEKKHCKILFYIVHLGLVVFGCGHIIHFHDLISRNKYLTFLNLCIIPLLKICIILIKSYSFIVYKKDWIMLYQDIAREETTQIKKKDPTIKKRINEYIRYTRKLTYLYWSQVLITNLVLLATPAIKYIVSTNNRERITLDEELFPKILTAWFPFDDTIVPGHACVSCFHNLIVLFGSGYAAAYDMNALAIMCYLKGQLVILKEGCSNIFSDEILTTENVRAKVEECHRHHLKVLKHCKMLNYLISRVLFFYILLSSIAICCSTHKFTLATNSEKLWIVVNCVPLVFQVFVYCWHGNEIIYASDDVDRGVFDSDWWKLKRGDKPLAKMMLNLAVQVKNPMAIKVGSVYTLSVATFMKSRASSTSFIASLY